MPKSQFAQDTCGVKVRKAAFAVAISLLTLAAAIPSMSASGGPGKPVKSASSRPDAATRARVKADYARLPLSFEQVPEGSKIKYLSRGSGYALYLSGPEAALALRQPEGPRTNVAAPAILKMRLLNGNPDPKLAAFDELPGKSNYFIGSDPSKWRTGVLNYARVTARGVYPGVDLVYHGNQGQLEYDFEVAPGARTESIHLAFEGARSLSVNAQGDLVASVPGGEVVFHAPVSYQEENGVRRVVPSRYVVKRNRIEFRLAKYDKRRPLVIDPTLAYSTYLGGSSIDGANGIAVAPDNTAFVAGGTFSADFPTAHPLQPNAGGPNDFPQDAFVTKVSSDGATLLYSTYLGGSRTDYGNGIAVDTFGDAYVTGFTDSGDFPVTPLVFDTLCGSDGKCGASYNVPGYIVFNGFVTKLNPAGSSLVYSSFIGGYQETQGNAIAIDSAHNAYITGEIGPPIEPQQNGPAYYFPVKGGFQTAIAGAADAFVLKVDATASDALYSSYLGGADEDIGFGIASDSKENAYVTGLTYSSETDKPPFPITANALQSTYGGGGDAFLVKVDTTTTGSASLVYSSYFGGSALEQASGIAVDADANAYITGTTTSTASTLGFTVPVGAYQSDCALDTLGLCEGDAFVAKFNAAKSGAASLVYFTYLGGTGAEAGYGIALDPSDNVYVTGSTVSSDFPVTSGVFQSKYAGGDADAFVAELTLADKGTADLDYASYLGGSNTDIGYGIGVDISGNAYVAGQTCSNDFPVADAEQSAPGGNCDAFVSKVSTLPGITLSPAGLSFPTENLGATSQPQTITVTNIGDTAVTISGITISGEFAQTNTCGSSLSANMSCTINVTFTPTANGVQKGTITLTDSAPGSPQTINLTGSTATVTLTDENLNPISTLAFPSQAVGTASVPENVVVTNVGTTAVTISSVTASGAFSESSTDNGDCVKAPLQPTTNCVIALTFTPVVAGSAVGALTVNDTAPGSPQVLLLTGTGGTPVADVTPGTLSFSSQDLNTSSAAQSITVKNTGSAGLTVSSVKVSGDFGESDNCAAVVPAAGSCAISVTFTPTVAGARTGSVTISDNAIPATQTVTLSGTGASAPTVTLAPTSLNTFSPQPVGTTSTAQTVTVTNSGAAKLTISSIAATGVFKETNTCPGSLAPQSNCVISVVFTPTSVGTASGSLTLTDNAPDSPQTVSLGGSGSDFALKSTPASGSIVAGASATFTVTVTPSFGFNAAVSISCTGAPAAATCAASPSSVTPDGTDPVTTTVIITTTARTMSPPGRTPWPRLPGFKAAPIAWTVMFVALLAMAILMARSRRPRWALAVLPLALLAMLAVAACGGGSGYANPTGTPAGNYTITVAGTSGSLSHTSTIGLGVK